MHPSPARLRTARGAAGPLGPPIDQSSPARSPLARAAEGVRRRPLLLAAFCSLLAHRASAEGGAVLVLIEHRDCPHCRRWHRDIGPAWDASDLGRRAPLRRVDLAAGPVPEDLAMLRDERITPTFILFHAGKEVGRIVGYQGETLFWQQAEALISRLPPLLGTMP